MERKRKKQKGITLIALVITIIVLLILAGVSIAMLTGDNGILAKAKRAKIEGEKAEITEQIKVAVLASRINSYNVEIDKETLHEELSRIEGITGLPTLPDNPSDGLRELPWEFKVKEYACTIDLSGEVTVSEEGSEPTPPPSTIMLTGIQVQTKTITIEVGEEAQINITKSPTDATEGVTYQSDDETVATVDESGKVTGVKAGTATITVKGKTTESASDTCTVTVTPGTEAGIALTDKNRTLSGETTGYSSKNPVIPQGFTPVTTEGGEWAYESGVVKGWNDGLIITDHSQGTAGEGNEFVWVPCQPTTGEATDLVKYDRDFASYPKYSSITAVSDATDSGVIPVANEETQIGKYGGFWVARYEAGLDGTQTDNATSGANNSNTSNPVSKKGVKIWNQINYTKSYEAANRMINNSTTYGTTKSGLITGKQWDTIMKWYEASGIGVTASAKTVNGKSVPAQDWGTYYDKTYSFVGKYFSGSSAWTETTTSMTHTAKSNATYLAAGLNSDGYKKNIADLGGNFWEWTAEIATVSGFSNRSRRGGIAYNSVSDYPASYRNSAGTTGTNYGIGFRVVLYIQ